MKESRLTATMIASSVSLLATFGVGEAIDRTDPIQPPQPEPSGTTRVVARRPATRPPQVIVIRRIRKPGGTTYVTQPTAVAAPAVAPSAPQAPTTRSS